MEVYCCFLYYMWNGILFDRRVLEVTDACFIPAAPIKAMKLTMKRYWNLKNNQIKRRQKWKKKKVKMEISRLNKHESNSNFTHKFIKKIFNSAAMRSSF